MANRRKKAKRWHWTHSIMLWAFVMSGFIHLCLVYFLPTIDFLPTDSGYIEIDETWLMPPSNEVLVEDMGAEPLDTGIESASNPNSAPPWTLPLQTEALEPVPATARNTDRAWEMAFIGLSSDLSDLVEQPERARPILTSPGDKSIPPLTFKALVSQPLSKQRPLPEEIETSASEPEIQIAQEVELQAEQRFQDILFSQASQPVPETLDPERVRENLPEIVAADQETLPIVTSMSRQASVRPEHVLAAVSIIPSPEHDKSLPPVVAPEIPERQPLEHEDTMAAAEPVMNFSEIPAQALRPEPPDELPEPETRPRKALTIQTAVLPELQQQEQTIAATPRLQPDPVAIPPASPVIQPPASALIPSKLRTVSLPESTQKQELILNDGEMLAVKLISKHSTAQVPEEPLPPADAPRPLTLKPLATPEQGEQTPMRRQAALSRTQRSLILGSRDQVPTLPLEGPRFGIVVRKEDAIPETELLRDTELRLDDTVQHAEQESAQQADEFVIEGPAATRQVLFKPRQFPDVELDVDVTIRLKFWVLPDGTVGEILPLQRGDVRLERAAIAYLKSWRFTPVSPDQPQAWGIIPITYALR